MTSAENILKELTDGNILEDAKRDAKMEIERIKTEAMAQAARRLREAEEKMVRDAQPKQYSYIIPNEKFLLKAIDGAAVKNYDPKKTIIAFHSDYVILITFQ